MQKKCAGSQKLVTNFFLQKILMNKKGMTVAIKSTETRRDETQPMEYHNCYQGGRKI